MLLLFFICDYYPAGLDSSSLTIWLDARYHEGYDYFNKKWIDMSGNNYHVSITPGVSFSDFNGGSMVFDGSGELIMPAVVSNYPVSVVSSVTHSGNWALSGSTSTNEIVNLNLGGRRVTLSASLHSLRGVVVCYGGTSHFHSSEIPQKIGPNDWNTIIYRIFDLNSNRVNINSQETVMNDVGGSHGGSPCYAIGGNGNCNSWDENWRGRISDLIIYNKSLSNSETKIINAYESMMSGTFNNSELIDQYNGGKRIVELVGIGRETINDMISYSVFSSGCLRLRSNSLYGSFLYTDGNYLIAAHNNESTDFVRTPFFDLLLKRKWFIQCTQTNTGIVHFDFSSIGLNRIKGSFALYYSSDESFLTNIHQVPYVSCLNNNYTINSENLQTGFYTLGEGFIGNSKNLPNTSILYLISVFTFLL